MNAAARVWVPRRRTSSGGETPPGVCGLRSGGSVYRLEACSRKSFQLTLDVASAVRDMMEAGAAAGEKASDRGIWSKRLQQLDLADERDSDPLLGQRLELSGRDPGKGTRGV